MNRKLLVEVSNKNTEFLIELLNGITDTALNRSLKLYCGNRYCADGEVVCPLKEYTLCNKIREIDLK